MKHIKNKKAFILLNTSLVIVFMILLVGTYVRYTTKVTSIQFHKDLVKIRGYWATYGAKESESSMIYTYYDSNALNKIYDINATRTFSYNSFFDKTSDVVLSWKIENINNNVIKDDDIYKRKLKVRDDFTGYTQVNETISYIK